MEQPKEQDLDASQKTAAGLYQCATCQRTYTRVDHLTRHVRTHIRERPFRCEKCDKAFGRRDLLKRHATCHDGDASSSKRTKSQYNQTLRVSQACKACATAKLKCDDEKPCGRCQQRGIPCHSTSPRRPQTDNYVQETNKRIDPPEEAGDCPNPSECLNSSDRGMPQDTQMAIGSVVHPQDHDLSEFLKGVMTPTVPNAISPLSWLDFDEAGPRGLLDFAIDNYLDFDHTDLGFLDQLCNSPSAIQPQPLTFLEVDDESKAAVARRHVALGVEAFKRSSLGYWLPGQQDHGDAEIENLSILATEDGSPDTRLKLDHLCLRESLNRTSRDELLAMVLATCKPERVYFVTKAFPQPELLDDLAQSFFSHHRRRIDSFIPVSSFQINKQKPVLLGAIVANGAMLTGLRSLHKLGFAFQEAVRTELYMRCEEANVITRELWILTSLMLVIESGMWSGIKRKMEIAESHPQVLYTMLRRAGRFHHVKRIYPLPGDTGEILHHKWLQWIEQESMKRLVFHAFIFDAQVCMAMLTSPIISYAELELSLPESRDLWMAEDAEQWKIIYLNQNRCREQQQLSLLRFLQQPTELPAHYDAELSSLIILHGIWGMMWQHLQLLSALKGPGPAHPLPFIALRHQELLQSIYHFRTSIIGCHDISSPNISMVTDLLLMYLHSSIKETQLFAGKGDIEDARRVLPSLQQWVNGPYSRQAIWHAGQVLRAAKSFPEKQLRDFYAIGVYHAALTLWTYGIISQMKAVRESNIYGPENASSQLLRLDESDSSAVQQFITLGKGIPCVSIYHDAEAPVKRTDLAPLTNPEAVMGVVVSTMRCNFSTCPVGEVLPPLVENLLQLLQDLGMAARNSNGY